VSVNERSVSVSVSVSIRRIRLTSFLNTFVRTKLFRNNFFLSRRNSHSHSHSPGFTLIEVLIALVIIAIALTAVMRSITQSIRVTDHVKSKMAAHWAALNVLSEIQLGLIQPPTDGSPIHGKTNFFNNVYDWKVVDRTGLATSYANAVEITVSHNKHTIETLLGYTRPLAQLT
jgi:general secretion pathway protein I